MVGDKLPGGKEIRWLHLGAAHKACFMVFALCSFKILAFSHLQEVQDKCFSKKVKRGLIFDKKTLKNLWQWGQYAVKCDIPQFLLTSLGRDAPINGLNLFKATLQYRELWDLVTQETFSDCHATPRNHLGSSPKTIGST